jgi:hypothetical protein
MGDIHPLQVTDVTRIAREAARGESSDVRVLGVTIGDRDGDYAEVIIDLENCRSEPCRMSVGVFRNAPERDLREQITASIRRHLQEHAFGALR